MRSKKSLTPRNALLTLVMIGIIALFPQVGTWFDHQNLDLSTLEKTRIDRVVDADTVIIESGQKVRLILINAPESVHADARKNTEAGKLASDFVKTLLTGKEVYLERDVSETDQYGRLLRYLWLPDGTMVNEYIVQEGYAQLATFPPDLKYLDRIKAAEKLARTEKRGLWGQ